MKPLTIVRLAADGLGECLAGLEFYWEIGPGPLKIGIGPTDSIPDLIRSCSLSPCFYWAGREHGRRGLAHLGYSRASEVLLDRLTELGFVFPGARIRVYGHSLGGAVARHLAYRLWDLSCVIEELQTFGEPASFKEGFLAPPIPGSRWVLGADLVAGALCPGYHHHEPATELPTLHPGNPLRFLLDHRLRSYERALE